MWSTMLSVYNKIYMYVHVHVHLRKLCGLRRLQSWNYYIIHEEDYLIHNNHKPIISVNMMTVTT